MELPLAPTALIVLIIVGHVIQIIWQRDDWPLSNYSMYSHLVRNHQRNPFVPLRPQHGSEAGFLVLVMTLADGSSTPLTTSYEHPLLRPFDRLRVIRQLTGLYKRGEDLSPRMASLAAWVHQRNQETGALLRIKSLDLQLYLWRRVPASPKRHEPPDEIVAISSVDLP